MQPRSSCSAGGQLLVATSLFATAALPFSAFVAGHPFRIRYMIPLVAACALFGGLAVGVLDSVCGTE